MLGTTPFPWASALLWQIIRSIKKISAATSLGSPNLCLVTLSPLGFQGLEGPFVAMDSVF